MSGHQADATKELDFCKLAERAECIFKNLGQRPNVASYIKSYPKMLRAAEILRVSNDPERLYGIAAIAYSWMPTILKNWPSDQVLNNLAKWAQDVSDTKSAAADVREGKIKFESLRSVNGTLVGTSKFLHLLAPDKFPIWDSVVARHWGLKHSYQYENPERYAEYLEFVAAAAQSEHGKNFREALCHHAEGLSLVRCIEFVLYVTAPKKNNTLQTLPPSPGTTANNA